MINRIAIIGGTGFESALDDRLGVPRSRSEISTDFGTASIATFDFDGSEIIFLARHGTGHSVAPHNINHHANIAALKSLDPLTIFSTSAVGSLTMNLCPGEVVILDDFIDFRGKVTTFFESGSVTHSDFSEPFSETARAALIQSIESAALSANVLPSIIHTSGTYLCVNGPRYETPAEIRCFGTLGAEVVGMTIAPEAILSRELGLAYAGVSAITNFGTGLSPAPLSHAEVEETMAGLRPLVVDLLLSACAIILNTQT